MTDEEIVARTMTALANEGARVLEEGFALRAGDVDVICCRGLGLGFPRHRGRPTFYAETIGWPVVLARVQEYRARFGDYWRPAALLERRVAEHRGLLTTSGTLLAAHTSVSESARPAVWASPATGR